MSVRHNFNQLTLPASLSVCPLASAINAINKLQVCFGLVLHGSGSRKSPARVLLDSGPTATFCPMGLPGAGLGVPQNCDNVFAGCSNSPTNHTTFYIMTFCDVP